MGRFRPVSSAIEKGVEESLSNGIRAGYPVVDVRVTLVDGKFHDTDSSEIAFKIAGSLAFEEAARRAKPALLEPIFAVEVVAPRSWAMSSATSTVAVGV